jgi:CheY-like chemotaxis protein
MSAHKGNILLVDDDPAILLTVGDQLRSEGYIVTRAENAERGLACLASFRPDLIILDIRMPGMGGIGLLKQMANPGGSLRYPVLVFTARVEMDEFFTHTSVDGFLSKTSDPAALLKEIERIIAKHRFESAARAKPGKWRVLLAEDHPEAKAALTDHLRTAGYDAHSATSGYELIQLALRDPPDVILLKSLLPKLKGPAVASVLAGMPTLARIPIVLYGEDGDPFQDKSSPNVCMLIPGTCASDLLSAVESVRSRPMLSGV